MSIFALGPGERAAIRTAVERAREHPIPWAVLCQSMPADQESNMLKLADRRGPPPPREPEQVMLPFGHRLAVTCEEQPAGLILHLSLSSGRPGHVPNPIAVALVLDAAGLQAGEHERRTWVEEFEIDGEPGGLAFNVALLIEPNKLQ